MANRGVGELGVLQWVSLGLDVGAKVAEGLLRSPRRELEVDEARAVLLAAEEDARRRDARRDAIVTGAKLGALAIALYAFVRLLDGVSDA